LELLQRLGIYARGHNREVFQQPAKPPQASGVPVSRCPVLLVTYGYNHGEPVRSVDADGFVDTLAAIRLDRIKTKTGPAPR